MIDEPMEVLITRQLLVELKIGEKTWIVNERTARRLYNHLQIVLKNGWHDSKGLNPVDQDKW